MVSNSLQCPLVLIILLRKGLNQVIETLCKLQILHRNLYWIYIKNASCISVSNEFILLAFSVLSPRNTSTIYFCLNGIFFIVLRLHLHPRTVNFTFFFKCALYIRK